MADGDRTEDEKLYTEEEFQKRVKEVVARRLELYGDVNIVKLKTSLVLLKVVGEQMFVGAIEREVSPVVASLITDILRGLVRELLEYNKKMQEEEAGRCG